MRQASAKQLVRFCAAAGFVAGLVSLLTALTSERAAEASGLSNIDRYALTYAAQRDAAAEAAVLRPRLKPASHAARWADTVDKSRDPAIRDEAAVGHLIRFRAGLLADAEALDEERRCLAQAMYYEARSESIVGQLAVADVVMNRVESRRYPSSICAVVFQGAERRTGCQFSFTCDGSMKAALNRREWGQAERLARFVMAGLRPSLTQSATHYHATYVTPFWAASLTPTARIGDHVFYKRPRRSAALAETGSAAL